MAESSSRNARIASVVAATGIALACGTNYAYSAWGPDFAEHMHLSATESNIIGMAGNLGMYSTGIPAGILIDSKGPKIGVLVGAIALASGYFPIYQAYALGPGFNFAPLGLMSFCSFLTGFGSCTAFSAAIKTATFNWPNHRGTATAFPLSGFGLSAFFFAALARMLGTRNPGDFLFLLGTGTLLLNSASFFFLRLIPTKTSYSALATGDEIDEEDNSLHLSKSRSNEADNAPRRGESTREAMSGLDSVPSGRAGSDGRYGEASSLEPGTPGRYQSIGYPEEREQEDYTHHNVPRAEITGLALLKYVEFWQLFGMMGLLAGVGLMTINNIGNDAKALWHRQDPNASPGFITGREQMHTSIVSIGSFSGRFISGAGSDIIVKRLRASRYWCLVFSASLFVFAQLLALTISNAHYLFFVSTLTGVAYGALFGCFPALVADAFGVTGMSLNWGYMIFAPVITGNIFNLAYGRIYDSHSPTDDEGKQGQCAEGLACYRAAYLLTLASSSAAVLLSLWCIRHERTRQQRARHGRHA